MIAYIILIISFLLDGILSNFLSYLPSQCSYFIPLFTLVCIFLIYPYYQKNHQRYFIVATVMGFLYDLFYTNLFFTHAILFFFIAYIISLIYSKIRINFFINMVIIFFVIVVYESIYALLLFIFNVVPIHVNDLLYQITHSLLLNIIYGEIIYLIYHLKHRKRRLN